MLNSYGTKNITTGKEILFVLISALLIIGFFDIYATYNDRLKIESKKSKNDSKMQGLNTISGIFLLILAVSGNFIAEVLGCKMQKILTKNIYAKNLIVILIIYFSLGFVDTERNFKPNLLFRRSILIWLFFLIFNKMTELPTIIVFITILSILIIKNWIDYYEKLDYEKYEGLIEKMFRATDILFMISCVITIFGFYNYLNIKYYEKLMHGQQFNYYKFIFGNINCDSLVEN